MSFTLPKHYSVNDLKSKYQSEFSNTMHAVYIQINSINIFTHQRNKNNCSNLLYTTALKETVLLRLGSYANI